MFHPSLFLTAVIQLDFITSSSSGVCTGFSTYLVLLIILLAREPLPQYSMLISMPYLSWQCECKIVAKNLLHLVQVEAWSKPLGSIVFAMFHMCMFCLSVSNDHVLDIGMLMAGYQVLFSSSCYKVYP